MLKGRKFPTFFVFNQSINIHYIYYTYDSSDNLVSMNLNSVEYYYIRNAQGDIIGLFDKTGTQVVSYVYDTWGKLISINGSLKDSVGVKNPYRYRGYRYDTETGLYYLQSRYYNPDWGRFINADGIIGVDGELLSHNMFAYCRNNPVNMQDPSGQFAIAIPVVIVGVVILAVAIVTILAIKETINLVVEEVEESYNMMKLIHRTSSQTSSSETSSGKIQNPNGKYKDAPYHSSKGNSVKSKKPKDGQKALDNSVQVKPNSPRRI